jgi:hypothetical protein
MSAYWKTPRKSEQGTKGAVAFPSGASARASVVLQQRLHTGQKFREPLPAGFETKAYMKTAIS